MLDIRKPSAKPAVSPGGRLMPLPGGEAQRPRGWPQTSAAGLG